MAYPKKPLRRATESSPDLGGMKRFIADCLAKLAGTGKYIIGVLPHPRTPEETKVALQWASNPAINDVYVDKDKIVFVNIPGVDGWLTQYSAAGISVTNGKNHNKYRKSVYRPTEIGFEFPEDMDIRVVILEADQVRALSHEDLSSYSDEQVEMIADGLFVLSDQVYHMMLESVEGNKNVFKTARRNQRVRKAHEFNVRLLTEEGFIKGDAVIANGELQSGAMVYTSRANVKNAIKVAKGGKRFLIAQPNGGKGESFSNIQELAWFFAVPNGTSQLFTLDLLGDVLTDHLERAFQDVAEGRLTERFSDVESFLWRHMKDLDEGTRVNTFTLLERWAVIEAAMRGFDYRTSPSMLRSVATNHRTVMRDFNGHPRFPLPNAEYKAVKSVTMLRMAGYHVETPDRGYIEYHEAMDVWYVCDRDWIDSYLDFGGQDGDDHFTVMSIMDSNGEHRIITWRMPMDSYKMFRTKTAGISHIDAHGNETFAFQMSRNSDVNKFPKTLSQLVAEGKVTVTGLPSQNKPKTPSEVHPLTREDVMDEIRGLSGQNAALGAYVNSLFLYRWVFKALPEQIPGMISDVVDTNDPDDAEFIMAYSAGLVREVLASGKPIPTSYWRTTREYGFNRVLEAYLAENPGYQVNFTSDDKLSRMTSMLDDSIRRFDKRVSVFAQENHGLVDPSIVALFPGDNPYLAEAKRLVLQFRGKFPEETRRKREEHQESMRDWIDNGKMGLPPTEPKSFSSEAWVRIRSGIMDAITTRTGEDRDKMVLALYVTAHTLPTKSTGEFNDNFLVASQTDDNGANVGPFPYFIEALRNFGILADQFDVDDQGNLRQTFRDMRTWSLTCVSCGTTYHVAKQEQVEAFRLSGRVCKHCRS